MRPAAAILPLLLSLPLLGQAAPSFVKAWVEDTREWNRGVAVTPSGDVVSLSSERLRIHARDTGKVVEVRPAGRALPSALCISGTDLLLVCEDGVKAISLPGGGEKTLVAFDSRAAAGAVAPGWAAAADRDGTVRVYSLADGGLAAKVQGEGPVEGVAVSPQGRCAWSREDGAVVLLDARDQKPRALWPGDGSGTKGIAFSPDGRRPCAAAGTFRALMWDCETGRVLAEYRTGSWVTAARFLPHGAIAAAGSDGLVLYEKSGEPARKLAYSSAPFAPSCEGLDVSPDGGTLVAGDRDGLVACFTSSPVRPSDYPPAPKPSGGATAQGAAVEVTGTLEGRKGSVVKVRLDTGVALAAGSRGTLSKHFTKEFAGFKTTGWLEIASVEVTRASGSLADLRILEKRSVVTRNGEEVDHFTPGAKVKLAVSGANP